MKERPILFSAPMVRAILDGRKTQTRRIAKVTDKDCKPGMITPLAGFVPRTIANHISYCPYGKPGDRLWVRETFSHDFEHNRYFYKADCDNDGTVPHLINGSGIGGGIGNAQIDKWKPSIHMPRRASRILLEATNVRVERLNAISEKDAIAEGCESHWVSSADDPMNSPEVYGYSAVEDYALLWESINGSGSWDLNPFVWVIEFRTLEIARAAA